MDRTNSRTGMIAAAAMTLAIAAFAFGMLVRLDSVSHASSLLLSWAYVVMASGVASEAAPDRRTPAYAGLAFAVLYAGFVGVVYFVQLTTVLQHNASADQLALLSFSHLGSLMFDLDLLGYGMMAVSTFFLGLSMRPRGRADRALKLLLMAHGVFAPACVVMPILNVFGKMSGDTDFIGVAVLLAWCAYFLPVGVLACRHFWFAQRL